MDSIDSNPALGLNMGPEMGCINDYKGSTQLEIISCAGGYLRFDIQTLKTPQIAWFGSLDEQSMAITLW